MSAFSTSPASLSADWFQDAVDRGLSAACAADPTREALREEVRSCFRAVRQGHEDGIEHRHSSGDFIEKIAREMLVTAQVFARHHVAFREQFIEEFLWGLIGNNSSWERNAYNDSRTRATYPILADGREGEISADLVREEITEGMLGMKEVTISTERKAGKIRRHHDTQKAMGIV